MLQPTRPQLPVFSQISNSHYRAIFKYLMCNSAHWMSDAIAVSVVEFS